MKTREKNYEVDLFGLSKKKNHNTGNFFIVEKKVNYLLFSEVLFLDYFIIFRSKCCNSVLSAASVGTVNKIRMANSWKSQIVFPCYFN